MYKNEHVDAFSSPTGNIVGRSVIVAITKPYSPSQYASGLKINDEERLSSTYKGIKAITLTMAMVVILEK